MHSEIIASKRRYFNPKTGSSIKTEYREITMYDDDEFDLDIAISELMDMLNDTEDPAMQEFARNRCAFLGWGVELICDPADYYADDLGYVWCISGVDYA